MKGIHSINFTNCEQLNLIYFCKKALSHSYEAKLNLIDEYGKNLIVFKNIAKFTSKSIPITLKMSSITDVQIAHRTHSVSSNVICINQVNQNSFNNKLLQYFHCTPTT